MMNDPYIPPVPQQLYNWFFAGTTLDCYGSTTAIKRIDPMRRKIELPFRDGTVMMDFDEALKCLKPATGKGNNL